jgi:hypothetical protein
MKEGLDLGKLKKSYLEIQGKYGLPGFDELNEDFHIEKLSEVETDFLIREIRKLVGDKMSNYLRFIETILHPVSAPVFVFSMIKSIKEEEKKILGEIYKKLAKVELAFIEADIEFSEEKEASFVKNSFSVWQDIKKDLLKIIEKVKKDWDEDLKIESNGKGYFG